MRGAGMVKNSGVPKFVESLDQIGLILIKLGGSKYVVPKFSLFY